jgi:transposase
METSNDYSSTNVDILPIVKEYGRRMGIVGIIDKALLADSGMRVSPGLIVLGLIMNILSTRSPLYLVEEFFEGKDVILLLGESMTAAKFTDDTIGRVLDLIYEYGTWKLFSDISVFVTKAFSIELSEGHQDTTSVTVWGEYEEKDGDTLKINRGHSKDLFPANNQYVINLLCAEGNIPIFAGIHDGNSSDKKINGSILAELPQIMAAHGVNMSKFIYVSDSAMVTKPNLKIINDSESILFISRMPANFKNCEELKRAAVAKPDSWQSLGQLSKKIAKGVNVCANYRVQESNTTIDGESYRTLILHSDVLEVCHQNAIDKKILKDKNETEKKIAKFSRKKFSCITDVEAEVAKFEHGKYHKAFFSIQEQPVFTSGRPNKDGTRNVKGTQYEITGTCSEKSEVITNMKEMAGCFVLLSNVATDKKTSLEILKIYKDQNGIESNFAFLKDPLIVNDTFLKKQSRIEALGLLLVLALLLSRLMERTMRNSIKEDDSKLEGWNKVATKKPTTKIIKSKFSTIIVRKYENKRLLEKPLNEVQLAYLKALEVSPDVYTSYKKATIYSG